MQGKKILLCAAAAVILLSGCASGKQQSQLGYVGADTAKNAALQSVGATKEQISDLASDIKTRDGQDYYEVTFTYGGQMYTYDVDAFTGLVIGGNASPASGGASDPAADPAVLAPSGDNGATQVIASPAGNQTPQTTAPSGGTQATPQTPQTPQTAAPSGGNATEIGEAKAKSIALNHAGVKEADVTMLPVKKDYENGRLVYDIEFYSPNGQKEYDYEIDVYTGDILSYDYDAENYAPPVSTGTTANNGTGASGSAIGEAKAKQIALAQVPGAKASNIYKFKVDYDDGRMEYEGEIIYNGIEYDFEIDAYSGKIIDWESERYDPYD